MHDEREPKRVVREVLSDGRTVAIEIRHGKVYGEQEYDWQAWLLVAGPNIAGAGKESPIRGGDRDDLERWARALTLEELQELADRQ